MKNNDTLKNKTSKIKGNLKKYLARIKRSLNTNVWTSGIEEFIGLTLEEGDNTAQRRKKVTDHIELIKSKYKADSDLVKSVIKDNEKFLKEFEEYSNNPHVREIHSMYREVTELHHKRIDSYLKYSNTQAMKLGKEAEDIFLRFDAELQLDLTELRDKARKLDVGDEDPTAHIEFRSGAVCPLIMHKYVTRRYPEIQEKLDLMEIDFESKPENKMLIEYKEDEIPFWDSTRHYWNQSKEALQFYVDEFKKIQYGIEIDGIYIEPWLYTHINVSKYNIPSERVNPVTGEKEIITEMIHPYLRDNEWWVIQDNYSKASKRGVNKKMAIVATRRAGKTTMLISKYLTSIYQGKVQNVLAGSSSQDLGQITRGLLTMVPELHPAFAIPMDGKTDTNSLLEIVIKTKSQSNIGEQFIAIVNTEAGAKTSSEKLAGYSMDEFNWDEFMKAPYLQALQGAEPAYKSSLGYRTTPILSGCVCAGTKVWDKDGNLCNIEDLKQEDGILGYSVERDEVTKENITWMKPPAKKDCYRITTNKNRTLECSDDHPILKRYRNNYHNRRGERVRKVEFVRADSLKKGDQIMVVDGVPFEGKKEMWEPRLVGMLIGDGSYGPDKTPILTTSDKEMNDYISERYDTVVESEYLTKDGRDYKETRIRGICHRLRELGIYGQTRNRKRLPYNIHSYRNEDICELLGGLFDADGHVTSDGRNNSVSLTSANKGLVDEVTLLLNKIGIHCSVCFNKPRENNPRDGQGWYVINIADRKSVIEFHSKIRFLIKRKQDLLEKCIEELKDRGNKLPREFENARPEKIVSVEYIGKKDVYNLTAGNTHTYIANGIITHNTGGSEEMSQDALLMLNNLEENEVFEMDWDLFESRIPEEEITWNRRDFSTFIPAQMAEETNVVKDDSNLADYLGIESERLGKIPIKVTNWKKANQHFNYEERKRSNDESNLRRYKVYFPRDPSDIFLSGNSNPYPADVIRELRLELEKNPKGEKVVLSRTEDGEINIIKSNKAYIKFPFAGGTHDAPATIYEMPVENPPEDFYTAGLDDVQQDKSSTDSVRAFVIWRRDTKKIVASLYTRPSDPKIAHEQMHMLLDLYNSQLFLENVNMDIKSYFDTIDEYAAERYLVRAINFLGNIQLEGSANRSFGYAPLPNNIAYLHSITYKTLTGDVIVDTENGVPVTRKVYATQHDTRALLELENYSPNRNLDGYDALRGAIALDHYLTFNNINPQYVTRQELEEKRAELQRRRLYRESRPNIGNFSKGSSKGQFSRKRKPRRSNF